MAKVMDREQLQKWAIDAVGKDVDLTVQIRGTVMKVEVQQPIGSATQLILHVEDHNRYPQRSAYEIPLDLVESAEVTSDRPIWPRV